MGQPKRKPKRAKKQAARPPAANAETAPPQSAKPGEDERQKQQAQRHRIRLWIEGLTLAVVVAGVIIARSQLNVNRDSLKGSQPALAPQVVNEKHPMMVIPRFPTTSSNRVIFPFTFEFQNGPTELIDFNFRCMYDQFKTDSDNTFTNGRPALGWGRRDEPLKPNERYPVQCRAEGVVLPDQFIVEATLGVEAAFTVPGAVGDRRFMRRMFRLIPKDEAGFARFELIESKDEPAKP